MQKLADHLIMVKAVQKLLSDREKPVNTAQVENVLLTLSPAIDVILNP